MKKNKKILMLAYYFPPLLDVGCKRSYYFSKYLKKHGWEPYVVSVKNPDKHYCELGNDAIPENINITYTYSIINVVSILGKTNGVLTRILKSLKKQLRWNFMYDFCIPDIFFGWIPLTILKSLNIIRKNDIKMIFATVTPFSSAIIGVILKKLTNSKLILDFRDPIALKNNEIFKKKNNFKKKIDIYLEQWVLRNCDIFTVTTQATKNAYIDQYPFIREKTYAIHNGFDPDALPKKTIQKFEKFSIIYTGDFYFFSENNIKYTKVFFEALYSLKHNNKISCSNFQFFFYGDNINKINELAKTYSVEDLVIASTRKPYKEILQIVSKSHLVLLKIISDLTISTKLLESIALNLPILATIPKGDASELIKEYARYSFIISDYSSKQIKDAILSTIERYKNDSIILKKNDIFQKEFTRENLTLKFINILNNIYSK